MRSVTVFLATYNGLPYVEEALRSLLAQSYNDFELVVLDDASTDGTVAAAEQLADERLSIIGSPSNLGAARNWSRAIERAATPFFALCHQDDVYEPEFLGSLLELLQAHPRAFIAHCKARTIDRHGHAFLAPADRYKERFWPATEPYEASGRGELEVLRRGSYIVTPAVLYRTDAVRQIGPFCADYRQSIDWDYWLRGILAGFSIVGTHRRLARYRRHPGMTTCKTEADLTRYRDEVRLLGWIADAAYRAGLSEDPQPSYDIVTKTLFSELARRLACSELASARALVQFAHASIPGFAGSPRHRLAQLASAMGATGGHALQLAQTAWLWLLGFRRFSRLPAPPPIIPRWLLRARAPRTP